MTHDPYDANRRLWEEWARIHPGTDFYRLEEFKRGGVRIRDYEIEAVGDVAGKDLLHLQCHFGIDTLSWARLGAAVTGVDYSTEAIETARALAAELGLPAKFVHSDIYELRDRLSGDFDVVYTSRGVIGWLPDLERWADVIQHFLRPGGIFYMTEVHPFADVFDDREGVTELRVRYPYWSVAEPVSVPVEGSYADHKAEVEQPLEYFWPHGLGEIVTALVRRGLVLELLDELPFLDWPSPPLVESEGSWRLPKDHPGEVPLMFSLRARKPRTG